MNKKKRMKRIQNLCIINKNSHTQYTLQKLNNKIVAITIYVLLVDARSRSLLY